MRHVDLSVYLVLDPGLCGGFDGMVETSRAAAQAGATVIQLRAPTWKKRALVECARAIKQAVAPWNVPLIVNDHADVCVAADAHGLHVGQNDLTPQDARAIIGPDRVLGLSVSNENHLNAVDASIVDHLGIGPIFATSTKLDADPAVGLDGFARLAARKPCPIVAIGSVTAQCAPDLIRLGADGVAVVSAICGQPNVAEATQRLVRAVRAAREGKTVAH